MPYQNLSPLVSPPARRSGHHVTYPCPRRIQPWSGQQTFHHSNRISILLNINWSDKWIRDSSALQFNVRAAKRIERTNRTNEIEKKANTKNFWSALKLKIPENIIFRFHLLILVFGMTNGTEKGRFMAAGYWLQSAMQSNRVNTHFIWPSGSRAMFHFIHIGSICHKHLSKRQMYFNL